MNLEALQRLVAVQQWLYGEAQLLDGRRFDLWLELLDPEIRYRIPSRAFVRQGDVTDFATWGVERELNTDDSLALIDDDLAGLRARVDRLRTGMGWAETPPSITRRLVGNVQVLDQDAAGLTVVSNLIMTKVRREERVLFSAERRDRLAPVDGGFRLRERFVVLDEAVLASGNLSLLF